MYIGSHPRIKAEEAEEKEHRVSIPENYAGNALIEIPPLPEEERDEAPREESTSAPPREEHKGSAPVFSVLEKLLPRAQRMFSSDALLIFLAILLSENEDGMELSILLLLLLLF